MICETTQGGLLTPFHGMGMGYVAGPWLGSPTAVQPSACQSTAWHWIDTQYSKYPSHSHRRQRYPLRRASTEHSITLVSSCAAWLQYNCPMHSMLTAGVSSACPCHKFIPCTILRCVHDRHTVAHTKRACETGVGFPLRTLRECGAAAQSMPPASRPPLVVAGAARRRHRWSVLLLLLLLQQLTGRSLAWPGI